MRHALCLALARYADQPLTPEVARAIVGEVCPPVQPLDLSHVQPVHFAGFVIAAERFIDVMHELRLLHQEHWLETEKYRHGLQLDLDYQAMGELELQGRLLQLTIRKDGQLAGHLRMFIGRSLHTGTRFGEEDTLFIRAVHRNEHTGHLMVRAMRLAEATLLRAGIREFRVNSKVINDADVLMRRLRYPKVAIQFARVWTDSEYAQWASKYLSEEDPHEPAA